MMIRRGCGKIIDIASAQSELARPHIVPSVTKGVIHNLARGMATDWAKYGLQINTLAPGYFNMLLNQALIEDAAFSSWLKNIPWPDVGGMWKN